MPLIPRILIAFGLCFAALLAVFVTALALALTLPSDARIAAHLRQAVENGILSPSDELSPYGGLALTDDECVGLTVNLSNGQDSLLYRLAAAPWVGPESEGFCESCECLVRAVTTGDARADYPYFRFWHGYQAYLRPMLSVMSLGHLRRVNAVILFAAFAIFCHGFARQFGATAWPVLLLTFAFVGDLLSVSPISVHALPLAWIFFSVSVVMLVAERRPDRGPFPLALVLTAFVAGAFHNFLSFLYNPPLALVLIGFPVFAGDLSIPNASRVARAALTCAAVMGSWGAGYALTWVAKWALAAGVLGLDRVVADVLYAASGQSYLDTDAQAAWIGSMGFFDPTVVILSRGPSALPALAAIFAAAALAVLAWGAVTGRLTTSDAVDFCVLQALLIVPVAWVGVLKSASVEHVEFVYRNFLPLAVVPVMSALMLMKRWKGPGQPGAAA